MNDQQISPRCEHMSHHGRCILTPGHDVSVDHLYATPPTPVDEHSNDPAETLAAAKTGLGLPKVVVLCGSTRFMDDMAEMDRALTWGGHIVIKPGCDMKVPHRLWADPADADAGKHRLDELHRAKIRLADEVVVIGDYVGDSTRAEISYARSLGKPVRFTDLTLATKLRP